MNKKITVSNYNRPLARGYIKEDEMHLLYDFPSMRQTECHDQLGMNLLDFIWLDKRMIDDVFLTLCGKYLITPNADGLVDYVRPIAEKNCYLMAYIAYAIELLTTDLIDGRFEEDKDISFLDELYDTYSIDDVKLMLIKQIAADITEKQKSLEQDIEMILGENSQYIAYIPAQRLYLLERKRDKASYLSTSFRTSFSSIIDLRDLSYENLAKKIKKENIPFFEMFELSMFNDLIRFEMVEMINHNCIVKRCKLCGKLFTPKGRSDSLFCSRIMEGEERPCIEIGPTRLQQDEINKNPIRKAYKRAYDRMSSRKRYKTLSTKDFQKWQLEAGRLRDKCLAGEITLEEYQVWLDLTKSK